MAAADTNPFGDINKIIEQFKMPGVDMTPLVDARRKDIEALVAANKSAYESMQALAQKQSEMLTASFQRMQEAAKSTLGGGVPDPTKQAETVRQAFEKTLADMKELAEMAQHSQTDALALITQRGSEHLQELQRLMQPKPAK